MFGLIAVAALLAAGFAAEALAGLPTGLATVLAGFFGAVFTGALGAAFAATLAGALAAGFGAVLSALRGGASGAAFALPGLEGFDFAATFLDFATALAMRWFDPQMGRRNRAPYTTLGAAAQAQRFPTLGLDGPED